MQIGQRGQLQEWLHDWDREDDQHRHVSHQYGHYPSNQISPYRTPELFQAAKTSLLTRGDESTSLQRIIVGQGAIDFESAIVVKRAIVD